MIPFNDVIAVLNLPVHNGWWAFPFLFQQRQRMTICRSLKVVRTEVQQTFLNGLLGVVTFGIYIPREARVYCDV